MKRTVGGFMLVLIFLCLACFGEDRAWDTYIQDGKAAMTERQYPEAEQSFRKALVVAERFGDKDARFAGTLLFLAQACDAQSKKEEAETLARRGVDSMNKALKAHKPKMAEQQVDQIEAASALMDQAGDIFASHHKYPDAEMLYQDVIHFREIKDEKKHAPKNNEDVFRFMVQASPDFQRALAAANEKLGNLYFSEHKLPEAAATYEKAQKIREANPTADKHILAQTITNLATCYAALGRYDQAEPLYQRSLKLFEEANWREKPEVLSTMESYALLLKKTGREEEANVMLEKAASIRKKLAETPR